jgi:hypothetical protein
MDGDIRCVARPHGTVAPTGAPPPFVFFEAKVFVAFVGKPRTRVRRENETARAFRPRDAGEGAPDAQLRFCCRKFSLQKEASERKCLDIAKTLAVRRVLRPLHHPASQGGPPLPLRGGG